MIKTNPLSVKAIATIARNFRKENGVELDAPFPVLDVIDGLVDKGLLTVEIMDNDDPYLGPTRPALYNTVDNFIYVKESVYEEIENENYRSVFTLAHELFHYIQTQVFEFKFEEVEHCNAYEEIEWQANEFAGELLVPKIYLDLSAEEIVDKFHVSMECALTRKLKKKKRENVKG